MSPQSEKKQKNIVRKLLDIDSRTYAAQAGIKLVDKPSPLYQLLVLSVLLSTRIKANIAVDAAKELFKAGYRTPKKCLKRAGNSESTH